VKFSTLIAHHSDAGSTQLKHTQINIGPAYCAVQAPSTSSTVPDTIPPAGEEKLHAVWLRALYDDIGVPQRGEDTRRAIDALDTIRANCDELIAMNPDGVVEKALSVAIRVEEREYIDIYPRFRDQALSDGNTRAAAVYQKVIDSEHEHANWFKAALSDFHSGAAVSASA